MNGLYVDSIIKYFGQKLILSDVFITCQQGEIIGLLGRNGSGKSSLLKIIFGSLGAENKFITIDDKPIVNLFDNRNLLQYLHLESFLPNHIKIKSIIPAFCNGIKADLLQKAEIMQPFLNKKSSELSGGERRITEILLMLYSDAKYLLLDEPFNGIEPIYVDNIKALIKEHCYNKGFIITDHDYRNVLDISTAIRLMHDGGIKKINHIQELIDWGYLPNTSEIPI